MIENPISQEYKSDHLFLLIGTNPLPNYVAAKLLLKPGGKVYMIHSDEASGTAGAAVRLESLLKKEGLISQAVKIQVDEARAADIFDKLTWEIQKIKSGTIGLHYTGGTKVMAVHAHRALRQAVAEQRLGGPICSYLDARTYEMLFDPVGMDNPAGKSVLLAASLNLVELLQLHDIPLKEGLPTKSTVLLTSIRDLVKVLINESAAKQWRTWCNNELIPNTKNSSRKSYLGKTKLEKVTLNWPTDESLQPAVATICNELGVEITGSIPLTTVKPSNKFAEIEDFCKWLDGLWLEHYVLDQIAQVAELCDINDYGMSLDTLQNSKGLKFEFDIGAMRGYQLFALSCTTGVELAKLKLFEAYTRAKQLGGDEARTALVCPHSKPEQLQNEIEQDAPGKVRVFGAEHLVDLKDHLAAWFTEPPKKG